MLYIDEKGIGWDTIEQNFKFLYKNPVTHMATASVQDKSTAKKIERPIFAVLQTPHRHDVK